MIAKKIEIILFEISTIMYIIFSDDPVMIYWAKVVLFAFFAVEILQIVNGKGKVYFGKGAIIATVFILYCACSLLWSADQNAAEGAFLTQIQLYVLFMFVYWFCHSRGKIAYYLHALFVSGAVLVIYALIKYGGPVAYIGQMVSGARMGGLIQNENTFGLNLTFACFAALTFYITYNKIAYLLFAFVYAFFALSSGSKKTAALLVIVFVGVFAVKYGIKKVYKLVFPILALIIVIFFAKDSPYFYAISYRLSSFKNKSSISDAARSAMRLFGYSMISQRPILGWGLRNFQVFHPSGAYSHDNFVEVAVSLGIVGLVNYYSLYVIPIIKSLRMGMKKLSAIPKVYYMLLLLAVTDFIFGYGMVQFYARTPWILLAFLYASCEKLYSGKIDSL